MELLKALEILLKVADVAQGKGIFTLEDACVVKQAKDIVGLEVKKLSENLETIKTEDNGNK